MDIPKFLQELLVNQYGENSYKIIEKGYMCDLPVTLRINKIKTCRENIINELDKNNIKYKFVNFYDEALIIENSDENQIRELEMYKNGEIYLQSLSSMLPVLFLDPKPSENILDMTSAPGGKTTQIASITQNKSYITACEKNKIRADRLKYNLDKQGVTCCNLMNEDARNLSEYFRFDKILLDAPCSGSGTHNIFDKNFTKELIERSSKTQEVLLNKALTILKSGGELIYSTCSILNIENENLLNKVIHKHNAIVEKIKIYDDVPTLLSSINGTICVSPNEFYEGFFIAKIKKG